MDIKDIKETYKVQKAHSVLLADKHYYNYVFKKTEKIACVVFYIVHNHTDIKDSDAAHIRGISDAALRALRAVHATLSLEAHAATTQFLGGIAALVELQSYVHLGRSLGVFGAESAELLDAEIEGVIRSMNRYIEAHTDGALGGVSASAESRSTAPLDGNVGRSALDSPAAPPRTASRRRSSADRGSRQARIRAIIAGKEDVSIKDISEDITDCSEKTIQRELTDMIEKGIIKREGERRWSTYRLL